MVGSANAAIKEEPVTYMDGATAMKGFVVYDDATQTNRPGIVMVHEWWCITKHIHNEARNFAKQGYTVLISDMYGDAKTADNPKDAGAVVLNMARAGADLAAVAGFHASLGLNTPAPRPGAVKTKVLILNGADDPFVKREQYDALKKDFDAATVDYRVIQYPGAVHALTNPEATELGNKFNLPLRYDAKADQDRRPKLANSLPRT
jgi:dienelactone hydrolase